MKKKGFTLIELLVVIAILGILVVLSLPKVLKVYNDTKKDSFDIETKNIFDSARNTYAEDIAYKGKGKKLYCNTDNCLGKKLNLATENNIKYSIKLNKSGEVICFQATNGVFYYNFMGNQTISEDNMGQYTHQVDDESITFEPDCTYSVDYRSVKRINVINIYPNNTSGTYSVKTRSGTFDNCQRHKKYISSSLKDWMEDSTAEAPKGFGVGVIKVIPVSFAEFNEKPDPDYWVKKAYDDGCIPDDSKPGETLNRTKADLMFLGIWDANGQDKYSRGAIDAIKSWTQSGKPIVAGHDVLIYSETQSKELTVEVEDLFGVTIKNEPAWKRSNKVFILDKKDKNIFTLWPWTIFNKGENGKDGLTIPQTHCTAQQVKGDVWVTLGETPITEEVAKKNFFYLETYNNTAIIQTGDSNCEATVDEQKMIANTIFFMYYKHVLKENGDEM